MIRIFIILFVILGCNLHIKAQETYGVIDFSVNYMREQPSYSAELGNQCLMGTIVEILDRQEYWLRIKSPEPYIGWVNEMGVIKMSQLELEKYLNAPKYICTAFCSKIFSQPSESSEIISDLVMGDIIRVLYNKKKSGSNYEKVKKCGFLGVLMPSGKTGFVRKKDLMPFDFWTTNTDASSENIVETAKKFLGVPYLWGGTSCKGMDCSGLTRMVWFMNGVLIPRDTGPQSRAGLNVEIFDSDGNLDLSVLRQGDLLFFGKSSENGQPAKINHVGIYIGNSRFIHSSQVVRISSLQPGDVDYYTSVPVIVRRYIGNNGLICIKDSHFY